MTLTERDPGLFGRGMTERLVRLERFERNSRIAAARKATTITRALVPAGRPPAPPRAGRGHTQRLSKTIAWQVSPTSAMVELNTHVIDKTNAYWIVQEIGTGQSATIKQGGSLNPVGRPRKGATYVRTVRSQRGRVISSALVFATGPRGSYVPAGAATGQQLFLRSKVRGAPRGPARHPITITKEITGAHFVQRGATEGFRDYRTSVIAAARQAFAGHRFTP